MDLRDIEWINSSSPHTIGTNEIHVWRFDLSDLIDKERDLLRLLSEDEKRLAKNFHFEKDRSSFVIRRALRRMILASYSHVQPAELNFTYNKFDKPAIEKLLFNASSSRGVGLIAITADTVVGIDVEFLDTEFPKLEIAERYFSTDEVGAVRTLPAKLQTPAFFECWTKKEAYVKATGEGMSGLLPKFSVSMETPHSFSVTAVSEDTKGWNILSFMPGENFVASVAYEGEQRQHSYFRWTEK